MEEADEVVREAVDRVLSENSPDWNRIKTEVRDALGEFVWKRMKRRPMILPILMEVEL